MNVISVNLKESYNIYIENGIIEKIGEYLDYPKIAVITDENVEPHYLEKVTASIKSSFKTLTLPSGEETKSFKQLQRVYDFLTDFEITRKDAVIALGGGVIGDLTGFAASTFLRGVPFIQVPTTLLAQVDSSVGGKVAINTDRGKNLIGSFYQPKAVFIDPICLDTLTDRVFSDGIAEVIKYGCIKDAELFRILLDKDAKSNIAYIIAICCNIKKQVVENDEFDTGERMILNFGHTIGHAIENHYNYTTYTHGEAVAIGMYQISIAGEKLGITKYGTSDTIKQLLQKYNLPFELNIDKKNLSSAMVLDKKSENDNINLIFLDEIGRCQIKKMSKQEAINLL